MSQTVPLAKPLSAQSADCEVEVYTRRKPAATTTPTSPSAAAGIGSVTIPTITAAKSAK